ncbi:MULTISPECIES: LysR substrate-binding domain-containing protein [Pseudomonas]|uniref:LysR substrate-binding domain-containing protein n=1 Tax=Pseudomonas TaxID=286 RepID=UPI001BEBB600|nr:MULTISPECIES: LysR substrate-binding domain-containing protein [Pseudomonas]MBT2339876.1 LysR family transcriptional regulator [Pseudomonas fluorescens]MCD4530391.1 LysR substrate-binding domain-containing protein [Pseudomonas sp. C3-2018]
MRKIPPLNSVRAFEAVARHQSFSAAANELSVTVAAVSHQVRQLEDGLGQKLLERGRTLTLTTAGKAIYPLLRDGFDQIAEAFALIEAPRAGDAIQVSTTRAFAERWLMPRLAAFNAIHPDIVVSIHASEKVVDLRSETIDLAIRYGPLAANARAAVLFEDRYIAVADQGICPAGHAVTIEDFHQRSLLAFKWKNQALEAPSWSAWLARVEHDAAREFRISWYSEETLALHALERGLGPLLCSNVLMDDELRSGRMRRIAGPTLPGFTYHLIENRPGAARRSLVLFRDWLLGEARSFRENVQADLAGHQLLPTA